MKTITILIALIFAGQAFAQSVNPNDTLKLGKGSSAADKALIFDTDDGVNNKKLSVEKASKLLKYDGNSFQLGDGAATDKELIINGSSGKSLKYNATSGEFEFNDDLKMNGAYVLKANTLDAASGTEVSIEQGARVKGALKIGTGNNQLRVSGGNLEFSNDGTLYKKVGSGSGSGDGGVSLFSNGSFEDGISTGWTNNGGTFTQGTYTNGPEGDAKFAQLVSSGSGHYMESSAIATSDFMVGGCLAKIDYYSTDASGTWKLQVYEGANLLAEQSLDPKDWQSGYTPFACPVVGTSIKLRVTSTGSGTIKVDRAYLGKENRTFQVAQAKLAGEAVFAATASCSWPNTGTALDRPTATAACPGPTIIRSSMGSWQTTDTDLPQVTVNNLPAGTYEATFSVQLEFSADSVSAVAITDGTTVCQPVHGNRSTAPTGSISVSCTFNYSTAGNRTFELFTAAASSTLSITNSTVYAGDVRHNTRFNLKYWPTDSQTALVPEAQSWIIDANIGGSDSTTVASAVSTYTPFLSATWDLVLNSGSAPAKITCSGGNAPTGLTCAAGSEQSGIAFTPPQAGWYQVCGAGGILTGSGPSGAIQWVETTVNTDTIIQEGKDRTAIQQNVGSIAMPFRNCGIFYFSAATERHLKLMYEKTGTVAFLLTADRSATEGQKDFHIVVTPMFTGTPRPYLTGDQVTTPGATKPVSVSAWVTDGSSATTVSEEDGDFINGNCTNSAAGTYVCSFVGSYWASKPHCWLSPDSGTTNTRIWKVTTTTASASILLELHDGTDSDADFAIFCKGQRN